MALATITIFRAFRANVSEAYRKAGEALVKGVDEGVANMQKALDIDKEYDDAMAYMNLLIRYRADLDDSTDAYKKDVEEADNWVQKALATKKIKAERKPQAGGITTESK